MKTFVTGLALAVALPLVCGASAAAQGPPQAPPTPPSPAAPTSATKSDASWAGAVGLPESQVPPPAPLAPLFRAHPETASGYPPPRPGVAIPVVDIESRQHEGPSIRIWSGAAYTRAAVEGEFRDSTIGGPGLAFGIGLGGAVIDDCIVSAELAVSRAVRPDAESRGPVEPPYDAVSLFEVGVGVSYYFMPHNVYAGASAMISQVRVDYDRRLEWPTSTDFGFGGHLVLGKEWWVSKSWGVGAALRLVAARVYDGTSFQDQQRWTLGGLSLGVSATFN